MIPKLDPPEMSMVNDLTSYTDKIINYFSKTLTNYFMLIGKIFTKA